MAQRRMLSRRISQSKKVNSLPIKAQVVYTWTIPYLDDHGIYTADAEDIKSEVFPKNKKISESNIRESLQAESEVGLVILYRVDGKLYQEYAGFTDFQTFKADRERKHVYPVRKEGLETDGIQRNPKPPYKLSKDKLIKDKLSKSFVPPTIVDIKEYIKEKGYNINPITFFDYFNESGWIDSKGNKVRSWKQKIITWSSHGNSKGGNTAKARGDNFAEQESRYGQTV